MGSIESSTQEELSTSRMERRSIFQPAESSVGYEPDKDTVPDRGYHFERHVIRDELGRESGVIAVIRDASFLAPSAVHWERVHGDIYSEVISSAEAIQPVASVSALEKQIGGSHYKDFPIQPIEFIHRNKIPFVPANVIKYVCRYAAKNGREDLDKAMHYLQILIELEYSKEAK